MLTTEKNIKLTRGDSFGFNFKIADADGETVELDTCYFSCKESPDDDSYIFQKNLNLGIQRLEDGQYYVKIEPEDTDELEPKAYYYDLQCSKDGNIYTMLKGKLDIKWDITKES